MMWNRVSSLYNISQSKTEGKEAENVQNEE